MPIGPIFFMCVHNFYLKSSSSPFDLRYNYSTRFVCSYFTYVMATKCDYVMVVTWSSYLLPFGQQLSILYNMEFLPLGLGLGYT